MRVGEVKTIELIFTPIEKPKNTEANIRNKILACLRNFMMKSKDPNKKKVRADSGGGKVSLLDKSRSKYNQ